MVKYEKLTLQQLKDFCRQKGARVSRRKKDLIMRLEAYDRNDDFGHTNRTEIVKWTMSRPEDIKYKDVSENTLTKWKLQVLKYCELKEDATRLYQNGYLVFLRISTNKSEAYFRSKCRASMKKSMSYFADIKMNVVNNMLVPESSQCECAAGMGPSAFCKHIGATFLAILGASDGSKMILEQSCTSQLQTFHRPAKTYQGSPIKSVSSASRHEGHSF